MILDRICYIYKDPYYTMVHQLLDKYMEISNIFQQAILYEFQVEISNLWLFQHFIWLKRYESYLVSINSKLRWRLFGNKMFLEIMKLNLSLGHRQPEG